MTLLAVFCGLPGTGKSTLARELAIASAGVHLRIDAIEDGLRSSALAVDDAMDAAYHAAWHLASENIALGLPVIGDAVNPVPASRNGWRNVAHKTGATLVEIEVICSDVAMHEARVAMRHREGIGPDWSAVAARHYVPPTGPRVIIDTALLSEDAAFEKIVEATLG